MVTTSLISTGNNYRIKKVIEKAQKGEKVTIAFIGGSITEGAGARARENSNCYAYQSYLYFKSTFGAGDGSNVEYINAGMGGTPSSLGLIRYDRDITGYGKAEPDIVFIEFAVNDYQETTGGEAYESLIRKVLSSGSQPAVILIFSVFKSRWNMQDLYKPIGAYYELPMISIKDAVVPELLEGNITEEDFFADDYHPTDLGHGIMTECVKNYFNAVIAEEAHKMDTELVGPAVLGNSFEKIRMLDSSTEVKDIRITPGGFDTVDEELCMVYGLKQKTFPYNWKHTAASTADPFVMSLKCRNLLLVYKSSSDKEFGIADVYVDGERIARLDSKEGGGWNNPVTLLLFKKGSSKRHTIEIRMAEGSEEKEFSLLAFGYTP